MGSFSFEKPGFGLVDPQIAADTSGMRQHFVAATGEFVGTFLFLLFAFVGHSMSVQQAADQGPGGTNSSSTIIYISLSYSMSLLVTVWTLYRVSGGLFNPAVTIGLIFSGAVPMVRGLILIPVQFISAICASAVASAIIPGDISTVQTTLAPDMSVARGFFLEMFLTAQLVFTILMLAAEKTKATFIAPVGIGLALFIIEIAGVYYTGGSVNPARSFGPCVAGRSFQSYHWIYWIAPTLGGILAGGYYHFVKFFNYEDANPGQDSAEGGFDPTIERQESGTLDQEEKRSQQHSRDGARPQSGYPRPYEGEQYRRSQEQGQGQYRPSQEYGQSRQTGYGGQQQQYDSTRSRQGQQAPYIPADVVQGMNDRV